MEVKTIYVKLATFGENIQGKNQKKKVLKKCWFLTTLGTDVF